MWEELFQYEYLNQLPTDRLVVYLKKNSVEDIKEEWMSKEKTTRGNVVQGRQEIYLTAAVTQVP